MSVRRNMAALRVLAKPAISLTTPATFGKISATTSNNPQVFQMALRYDF